MQANHNIKTLSLIINEQFGEKGTPEREQFDNGYENFKLGHYCTKPELKKDLPKNN